MTPPAVATWLLSRFGVNQSVVGDLIERYQVHQSRSWYWRQAFAAIVVGVAKDLRDHPVFAVRTFVISAAVFLGLRNLRNALWYPVGNAISIPIGNWLLTNEYESARSWWFAWHLYDLPRFAMWWLVCVLYGWVVVRLHRSHRPSVAILCAASALMNVTWWLIMYFSRLLDAPPSMRPDLLTSIVNSLSSCVCVCAGGMWAALTSDSNELVVDLSEQPTPD